MLISILIPTKGRPQQFKNALRSVINQNYSNFEIIISDNNQDTYIKKHITNYNDPRIKYINTNGTLSMPDNWQAGLSLASGEYITVLQDKQIYYPGALNVISKYLSEINPDILTWRTIRSEFLNNNEYVKNIKNTDYIWSEPSTNILKDLTSNGPSAVWTRLPRLINSCVKHDVIYKLYNNTPLNRFFIDVTPDLSASFIQLELCSNVHHLEQILTVNTSRYLSSGLAVRKSTDEANNFYNQIKNKSDICRNVPIKNRFIVTNVVINDYINVQKLIGKKLCKYNFESYIYIKVCIHEITRNISQGIIIRENINDVLKYIKTFKWKTRIILYSFIIYYLLINLFRIIRNKISFHISCTFNNIFGKNKYINVDKLFN